MHEWPAKRPVWVQLGKMSISSVLDGGKNRIFETQCPSRFNCAFNFLMAFRISATFSLSFVLRDLGVLASKVFRHLGLPHQQGYWAINFLVMGSSI